MYWNTKTIRGYSLVGLLLAVGLGSLPGCGSSGPAEFRLNMPVMVEGGLVPTHRQQIADTLEAMFGTPDEPFAMPETGLNQNLLQMAAGPVWSDKEGGKHGLYRRHCSHCHGISGDGLGPTAMILNPYPRDYRQGVFKFKGTFNSSRPTDADLHRIVMNGVPGTAMPSFALLPPTEVEALVEYVKYLSIRGQMETALVDFVVEELDYDTATGEATDPLDPANDEEQRELVVGELLADIVTGWEEAAEQTVVPEDASLPEENRSAEVIAASVTKGRALFFGPKANCVKCHGPTALGDGQQTDHDNWLKANKKFREETNGLAEQIETLRGQLKDLKAEAYDEAKQELAGKQRELAERNELVEWLYPLRNAIPRNLRLGIYRGGHRPLDLYWRVNQGIAGTPMPASGKATPDGQATLTDEEIWQIVDYVRSLPFEAPSQAQSQLPQNKDKVH